jgi:hypothetical protein
MHVPSIPDITIVRCKTTHHEQTTWINLLKPSNYFPYHQVWHSKILHGARFALNVCTYLKKKKKDSDFYFILVHH